MSDLRVTMVDVYETRMCASGAVGKLKALGYDRNRIRDILKNGIPIDEARNLGDGQMDILIANAEKRMGVNNG